MIRKGDVTLSTLNSWEALAGPKSRVQWQDDRSAKECARAWLEETDPARIPEEILQVLRTHEDFREIARWEAEPECLVPFDQYGGPANIDMLVSAEDDRGRFVMAVEAKADESFGPLVSRALSAALERLLSSSSSRGLARVEELTRHILGPVETGQPRLHQIRYQLVTAAAAALSRAKEEGADRAVVMVHEFETRRTEAKRRARNAEDLVRFLRRLGVEGGRAVLDGRLVGPIRVAGGGRFEEPAALYVGKAKRLIVSAEDGRTPEI